MTDVGETSAAPPRKKKEVLATTVNYECNWVDGAGAPFQSEHTSEEGAKKKARALSSAGTDFGSVTVTQVRTNANDERTLLQRWSYADGKETGKERLSDEELPPTGKVARLKARMEAAKATAEAEAQEAIPPQNEPSEGVMTMANNGRKAKGKAAKPRKANGEDTKLTRVGPFEVRDGTFKEKLVRLLWSNKNKQVSLNEILKTVYGKVGENDKKIAMVLGGVREYIKKAKLPFTIESKREDGESSYGLHASG